MQNIKQLLLITVILIIPCGAAATVAPKNGGELPQAYWDAKAKDPTAFTMKRAWIQKTQRIRELRQAYLAQQMAKGSIAPLELPQQYVTAGTLRVPVFLCEFTNRSAPFDSIAMKNQLFDNNPTGTITEYYDEVSYSNLTLTGTVYAPVTLSQSDVYYEGIPPCNGVCVTGHMGQLIQEILDAKDPSVDFGQYDNDGPDGVANSGDDDGFVDFVAFVHPESGSECGSNNNILSHTWEYAGWPESGGFPYTTDDPAQGGGFIKVSDYTMQPAKNCDDATIIDIGVFCHEFGHGFGLPDLYDTTKSSSGIGWWGIMGSGNWNTPKSPAHPCAWTRIEMGWVTPIDVGWQGGVETIDQIFDSKEVFRLGFTDDHFRRSDECVINGNFSLYCGLTQREGQGRGWGVELLDNGYGNVWTETIQREFTFDGSTPVHFTYDYQHDTQAPDDFGYAIIEVQGTETVLEWYTGPGSGSADHDITSYLSGLTPPAKYKLKFRGTSDLSWSDDDAKHDSDCGLLVIDNVAVTGGGESYSSGFETYVDGWHQSPSEHSRQEYWLVENRQPLGFDSNLLGAGLLIMHVDETVIKSPMGNTGNGSIQRVKGVAIEEADGLRELERGLNTGDGGDVFPGSTNNVTFDVTTFPGSLSNGWMETVIEVSSIDNTGAPGIPITAYLKAGDPAPVASSVLPNDINNDEVSVPVAITGDKIRYGATFLFTYNGGTGSAAERAANSPSDNEDIVAESLRWIDPVRLVGTLNVYSKAGGSWDLVVTNPDGQEVTLADAITINQLVAVQLQAATIDVVVDGIRLEYVLFDREPGETLRVLRSTMPESEWTVIVEDLQSSRGQHYVYVDTGVEPGKTYVYRLVVVSDGNEIRELHKGSATVPAGELLLSQNFPNPFNPTTSITFYLPRRAQVRLDVFDIAGHLVTRLSTGLYQAGPHRIEWDGTDANGSPVGSGVYVYRLTAGKQMISRKMLLLK